MAASKAYTIGCSGIPAINAGMLRHQINFQRLVVASPPTYTPAGLTSTWTTAFSDVASIEAMSGKDMVKEGMTLSLVPIFITLYWRSDVTVGMRVARASSSSVYIIQAIQNVMEMDSVMVLTCLALGSNT